MVRAVRCRVAVVQFRRLPVVRRFPERVGRFRRPPVRVRYPRPERVVLAAQAVVLVAPVVLPAVPAVALVVPAVAAPWASEARALVAPAPVVPVVVVEARPAVAVPVAASTAVPVAVPVAAVALQVAVPVVVRVAHRSAAREGDVVATSKICSRSICRHTRRRMLPFPRARSSWSGVAPRSSSARS